MWLGTTGTLCLVIVITTLEFYMYITATLQYLLDVLSFGQTATQAIERPRLAHNLIPDVLSVEGR